MKFCTIFYPVEALQIRLRVGSNEKPGKRLSLTYRFLKGTQQKYGVEIAMRGAVEAAICEHYKDDYNIPDGDMCRLPMICILLEGGPNSIATCVATTRNGN